MSFRTILVGIIAAVCGVFATAGLMMMNLNRPAPAAKQAHRLLVAKINIDLGQKLSPEMLTTLEWFSDNLPSGTYVDADKAVGQYAMTRIHPGELVIASKLADTPTVLQISSGMRGYSIEAKSESTTVGQNLIPGNRVDIIWQTANKSKNDIQATSVRLLQNVRILAVSDPKTSGSNKSVTLEVKPNMDENLNFAQAVGTLSLSLRNPDDNEGVDPVETINLRELFARIEAEKKQEEEDRLRASRVIPAEAPRVRRGFERIAKGMRAITIETPSESTGVAGLLEPGDHVDLQFTLGDKNKLADALQNSQGLATLPTARIIENLEVLAVDTKLDADDKQEPDQKMSRSVTLIVMDGMESDIARAQSMGTLSLALRGADDRDPGPPRTLISMDEFVVRHMPKPQDELFSPEVQSIRTYRGQSTNMITFARARTLAE